MLDVHPAEYPTPAKGFLSDWLEVTSVDDVFLALAPSKRLEVLLHFLTILEDQAILLNPLISQRVYHDFKLAMGYLPATVSQLHLFPVLERDDRPPGR